MKLELDNFNYNGTMLDRCTLILDDPKNPEELIAILKKAFDMDTNEQ
jgi:hypothetical protein